jgi:TonB family protein
MTQSIPHPDPIEEGAAPPTGSPIHILYLIDVLWGLGGAEGVLLRIPKLLPKDRYRCTIGTFRLRSASPVFDQLPCPIREFPVNRVFGMGALRAALDLRRFIRSERVQIVHTFFESADLLGGLVAKLSGVPVVISSRRDMGILRSTRHHIAYRLMSPLFDQVHAVSGAVRQQTIRADRIDPDKVVTVPNGIEIEKLDAANSAGALHRSLRLEDASPLIVSVGHIRRVKGFDVLLRAAAEVCQVYPKATFLIVGSVQEPDCDRDLRDLVRQLDLERNVRFLSKMENESVWSLLKLCDVFCQPSRSEGMSNALLEAMGCGLPCVATAVGGTPEVLEDGRTGYVVPREDHHAAANRILALLGDPERARTIPLVLWLIDHHPESALHGYVIAFIFPDGPDVVNTGVFEDARSRWLAQVNLHPDDARVLGNTARALGEGSLPEAMEAIDLMKRAQKLDPAHRTEPLAKLYSFLLMWTGRGAPRTRLNDPAVAARVGSELRESNDAALVGTVARYFVEAAAQKAPLEDDNWDFTALRTIATELVTHAQALEPQNRDWADLMEGVKGLPSVPGQPPAASGLARIGAGVAASMLQESSKPVYPPLAKAARLQGVVKLQVRIGKDGHVTEITVLSGHPLLVPAAMDAVKDYVYKPVMIEGKAVDVMTTVEVAFGPGGE